MESNHHCILRGDMSYPLNDGPKRGDKSKTCFRFIDECQAPTTLVDGSTLLYYTLFFRFSQLIVNRRRKPNPRQHLLRRIFHFY